MNSLSRDAQVKIMEGTVNNAEKYLGQFCMLLASYTRKNARLRDKVDLLVRQIMDFANTENPELRRCLKDLGEELSKIQDYRQAEVERLDAKVIAPLKAYGPLTKSKRSALAEAEANVQKASVDVNHTTHQLEEIILKFQQQKLKDIKAIFSNFVTIEMIFHAKALEVYTNAFQYLNNFDEEKDLKAFKSKVSISELENDARPSSSNSNSTLEQSPASQPGKPLREARKDRRKSSGSKLQTTTRVLHAHFQEDESEEEEEEEEEVEELQDVSDDEYNPYAKIRK
ncbi:CBY1-interacting BAR domain-containing protein 2-like isoform X2 [Chiloscyllium plagiosum]|uniref:CBY1-interacting BAR domain-containing protein 2-like isoform X2 n=1 Tax=Chiloscyllium plagiosum TaxID=36176 RepID=UPI001CB845A6|nr:CBY1-interacting BAR domain-containing protein 2-like isoform X2 [Chiloscyllium plagiosum]